MEKGGSMGWGKRMADRPTDAHTACCQGDLGQRNRFEQLRTSHSPRRGRVTAVGKLTIHVDGRVVSIP